MAKRKRATQTTKQLTPRQTVFAKSLVSGATLTDAARTAGYSGKNLAQSGYQALKTVQSKMPELMAEAGLTPPVIIEKYLVPLLSATIRKCFQYKGKVLYSRALPDWRTRAFALDMLFRLTGAYRTSESVAPAQTSVEIITIDAEAGENGALGVA